eukprot:CAMPEP_0177386864 /NCGR_PEP_ID=MMETSP0368-20130122/51040_1 /TAXON_ID=447022 ORGANISM="Scrippsiella hangoei-like, Strain SHHI-4" /NCGR_SAMPLE_ID=MMETSP0368 /ASSEMBLY_ACC=CAM_ASM_000363 /LENGTH=204 /DNA_ID=CAMNT_0018851799 /DNA_START=95 /DNA_END=707 /DNA_ORIENTATION=+
MAAPRLAPLAPSRPHPASLAASASKARSVPTSDGAQEGRQWQPCEQRAEDDTLDATGGQTRRAEARTLQEPVSLVEGRDGLSRQRHDRQCGRAVGTEKGVCGEAQAACQVMDEARPIVALSQSLCGVRKLHPDVRPQPSASPWHCHVAARSPHLAPPTEQRGKPATAMADFTSENSKNAQASGDRASRPSVDRSLAFSIAAATA